MLSNVMGGKIQLKCLIEIPIQMVPLLQPPLYQDTSTGPPRDPSPPQPFGGGGGTNIREEENG